MRKNIFILLLLFVGIVGTHADNTLAVNSAVVTQGQDSRFSIELINSDELTAMQFDLTLPEGITFKDIEKSNRLNVNHAVGKRTVEGTTRITLFAANNELITGESGTTIFTIVVTVDGSVALGDKAGKISNMEMAKKDETSFNPEAVDFTIKVKDANALIKLGSGKTMLGYSYDQPLDFTAVTNAKAWIATGYLQNGKVMLCRVNVVPANTGFIVTSDTPGSTIEVPVGDARAYYSSLLIPILEKQTISSTATIDGTDYTYMGIGTISGTGSQGFVKVSGTPTYGPNRCLLQVPTEYVSSAARSLNALEMVFDEAASVQKAPAGETATIQLGSGKTMLGYSYDQPLDFTTVTNAKAWIATGYLQNGKVMLCRVNVVPANTGFIVTSDTPGSKIVVPVSDARAYYASLLIPVLERQTISGTATVDGTDYTYMGIGTISGTSSQGFVKVSGSLSYGPNRCLLQVPTEYVSSQSGARSTEQFVMPITVDSELTEETTPVVDVLKQHEQQGDTRIYNLNGQRRSSPGKGLNIIDGRKVVIK